MHTCGAALSSPTSSSSLSSLSSRELTLAVSVHGTPARDHSTCASGAAVERRAGIRHVDMLGRGTWTCMYVCSCRRTCAGALGSPPSSRRSSASSSRSTSLSSRGWPCWGAAVAACSTCDAATRVSRPCDACKQGRSGGQPERARANEGGRAPHLRRRRELLLVVDIRSSETYLPLRRRHPLRGQRGLLLLEVPHTGGRTLRDRAPCFWQPSSQLAARSEPLGRSRPHVSSRALASWRRGEVGSDPGIWDSECETDGPRADESIMI